MARKAHLYVESDVTVTIGDAEGIWCYTEPVSWSFDVRENKIPFEAWKDMNILSCVIFEIMGNSIHVYICNSDNEARQLNHNSLLLTRTLYDSYTATSNV